MKRKIKTAYELSESQVWTPQPIVSFFWSLVRKHRPELNRVLDMGAGDGRFALGGHFESYEGIEIDRKPRDMQLPQNAKLTDGCVFRHRGTNYDACIGNPPYVRHHDIESPWKQKTTDALSRELGVELDRHGNLYLYFMCLGMLKAKHDGLVAFIVPFEWVTRPSAKAVREYINGQGWDVSVYRFQAPVFPGVLTTASVSIIDKRGEHGKWQFYDVLPKLKVRSRKGVSGTSFNIISHEPRGKIWARRAISPGSQDVFTLTEDERIHANLTKRDVVPCVTTLRNLPRSLRILNRTTFEKYYVNAGRKCWLIRSNGKTLSERVKTYLNGVPKRKRQTYTCLNQYPWYAYEKAPVPKILLHSGFTVFGPKVLINTMGVHAVGSVYGVHTPTRAPLHEIQNYLLCINFEKRVVAHAKTLKKIEVGQLNAILSCWQKNKLSHEKN